MLVSFENTEIAFSSKNNSELNRAFLLFKLIGSNKLVKAGSKLTELAIRLRLPIGPLVKATIFKHFCGGEDINECDKTIKELGKFNIGTILDYSVEGKESEADFDRTTKETIETIHKAKGNPNIPFCVFKITGLGRFKLMEKISAGEELSLDEKNEFEKISMRVNNICKSAHDAEVRIFIDAEESWIQELIDTLATSMMMQYNKKKAIVYNTLQMYRHDRLRYLVKSYEEAAADNYFLGVKLVRGAYMEKERKRAHEKGYASPIQPDKFSSDRDYDQAIKFCIENIDRIALCAGSHNEKSTMLLVELMKQKNIPNNHPHVYFSQLLGMSDHLSYNLAKAGYNVAKYVPYGPVKDVLPYLIRRAQENTSVGGQMSRELGLIIKEKLRRKKKAVH